VAGKAETGLRNTKIGPWGIGEKDIWCSHCTTKRRRGWGGKKNWGQGNENLSRTRAGPSETGQGEKSIKKQEGTQERKGFKTK